MKLSKFIVSAFTTAAVVGAMGMTYAQMGDNSVKEPSTPAGNSSLGSNNPSAPIERSNAGMSATDSAGSTMNSDTLAPRADRG
jgi:hypothetical protein